MIVYQMDRDDMIILVAAIFALEHNHRKPDSDAIELMKRSLDTATTFVNYCRMVLDRAHS